MNLLAEKILAMDSRMDKRISRLWTAAIAILVGVTLLALKFVLGRSSTSSLRSRP